VTGATGAPRAEQTLIDNAAAAWTRLEHDSRFAEMDALLARAHAVMIFPRLIKASFIFGGEGGTGVLLARGVAGDWSDPAFYSLGSPSVGLQIGFQEATVVLFILERDMLDRLLDGELTLGKNISAVIGPRGEQGQSSSELVSKPIRALVDAAGAYAGISLDGYVIGPRQRHNIAYYGEGATPRAILIDRTIQRAEARALVALLSTESGRTPPGSASESKAPPSSPSAPSSSAPSATPTPSGLATSGPLKSSPATSGPATPGASSSPGEGQAAAYRECSPESRQVEACTMIDAPVCAEIDTGVRCVRAPCPGSRAERTFENACRACADPKTYGYRNGACAANQNGDRSN
jgi:lipid-binding SYLF domain-containing protein